MPASPSVNAAVSPPIPAPTTMTRTCKHLGLILDNFVNLRKIFLELWLQQRRLQCVRIGQFPEIDYRIYTPDDTGVAPHQLHVALGQDGGKVVKQRNEVLELPRPESDRCL